MFRIAWTLTALAAVVATALPLVAQDPGRDLPHVREPDVPASQRVERIVQRLVAGWDWEAARLCREMIVVDGAAPLPHALLALAMRHDPNRAARHCWQAVQRRANGSDDVRALVDALQRYFAVDSQPELVDERFAEPPPRERHLRYVRDLRAIRDAWSPKRGGWLGLVELERLRLEPPPPPAAAQVEGVLRRHNAYLAARRAMPFELPGYADLYARFVAGRDDAERALARLPRHPDYGSRAPVPALPGFKVEGSPAWTPGRATKFTLTSGLGGTETFDPAAGRPTLIVFFLGFGCAHCVAQLKDLDPKAAKFRAAGIEVISVGTDTLAQVRAAQQAALENGIDPLHFDVLCDPDGEVFRRWNVWDQFQDEALHGTFFVDGEGRILWQDVSERPFEQSGWLLAECRRLLAAWR